MGLVQKLQLNQLGLESQLWPLGIVFILSLALFQRKVLPFHGA